jgi:hypothetical protein
MPSKQKLRCCAKPIIVYLLSMQTTKFELKNPPSGFAQFDALHDATSCQANPNFLHSSCCTAPSCSRQSYTLLI